MWGCGLYDVAAMAVHDACVGVVGKCKVDGAEQVTLHVFVIDGCHHLDAVEQVAWHPVGAAHEIFG